MTLAAGRIDTQYLWFGILPFAPAGFVSIGVRNLPCNLIMFIGGAFVINWMRINWDQRDTVAWVMEGWGWLQYYYCILGIVMAISCILYLTIRHFDRKLTEEISRKEK